MLVRKFGVHKPLGNGPVTVILPTEHGMKICVPSQVLGQASVWAEISDTELAMLNEWRELHPQRS